MNWDSNQFRSIWSWCTVLACMLARINISIDYITLEQIHRFSWCTSWIYVRSAAIFCFHEWQSLYIYICIYIYINPWVPFIFEWLTINSKLMKCWMLIEKNSYRHAFDMICVILYIGHPQLFIDQRVKKTFWCLPHLVLTTGW